MDGRKKKCKVSEYIPSILIVQSMAVKKVQLVLFQQNIQTPSNKLMISKNYDNFLIRAERE